MTWKRRDKNHLEIIKTLRKLDVLVFDTADLGKGFPDAICHLRGRIWLIEIKDGSKPPSQQKLTKAEEEFHALWHEHICIINSIDQAVEFVNRNYKC